MRDSVRVPEVSVIIPLYNKRGTVSRAINSVLSQDFTDFELIVVDDGSTDDSGGVVREGFKDPRLSLVSQANAGPGAARNAGAALARGRLFTFLDADDAWRPQLLSTAVATLAQNPDCMVFTAAFMLEPEHVDRWSLLRGFWEGPWQVGPDIKLEEVMDCLAAFHSCTAVYRREVFERFGGFYAKNRCTLGEDVFLWLPILLNSPIYRHTTPLASYHMEDSELGIGGRPTGPLPLEPVLLEPDAIYAVCPSERRPFLDAWLAQHAWRAAAMQLGRGDARNAAMLLDRFPQIRTLFPKEFAKLKIRMLSPGLWNAVGRLRSGK